MNKNGFKKLFWGFLFIMFDFRVGGFDILPDIAGYILFVIGFGILLENSFHFSEAKKFSFPLILLSLFQIYEPPVDIQSGINIGPYGILGVVLGIATLIFSLLTVYHLFMGIKDMAESAGEGSIYDEIYYEAETRWKQYLILNIASLAVFVVMFIPLLNFFYIMAILVASIVLMIKFMKFMNKCGYNF